MSIERRWSCSLLLWPCVTLVASVTTLERVNINKASKDAPPGTIGLAKPHGPIDRAPGEPLNDK